MLFLDKSFGAPLITNDGVTIAKEVELEDAFENMGAQLVKEVATKTNDVAGDGTTTATVLAQAMINEGMKNLAAGANPIILRKGMKKATETAVDSIRSMSSKLSGKEQIAKVAAISAGDEQVGEMVADLERAGKRHAVITGVVEGGDPGVQAEIEDWCRAAQVRRRFRDTNIAQIGRPYPGMMDLYIDETNLYNRMGVYTKQFDWERMWAIADNVNDEEAIAAKIADIHNTFEIKGDYEEESIREMARYVLAFEQWVRDEQLGLVASHYDGLAQGKAGVLDSMLIPAFSMLIKQGTVCAVEGDMKVAMGMSIMKTISGACQLSEFYTFDFNDDVVLIGHSGSGDACFSTARKASMEIVPVFHGKTGGGFLTRFYPKPGPVTYLAITQDADGHFKFIVSEGVIEDGPTLQNGDTTFRTRFSIGAREWNNRWCECGPTHHFAAAQGSWTGTIQKVAEILNVPVEVVC